MGLKCSTLRSNMAKECAQGGLHNAIKYCDGFALSRLLLAPVDADIYDRWGISPLHLACEIGDENLVHILLAMGADVNLATSPTQGCVPPLVFAASNGHSSVVRLLLGAGAAVDAADDWGSTAIFKAATYNHLDCVKILLKYNADPDKGNRWGALPLQYAAHQGHHKVIKALLDGGCDVTKRGEESVPPALAAAATRGYHKCVSALIKGGADINFSKKSNGETALFHAIKYCQHAVNEYLTNSSASVADRLRCIKNLLHAGADVTPACVSQLCTEDYFPNFACESSQAMEVLLIKLILRALPCQRRESDREALQKLFQEVAMTMALNAPLMNELSRLVCSVGYDPSDEDVDAIGYALFNDELASLMNFRKNPRSLMDKCRLVIRSQMAQNVIAGADKLPLPKALRNYVTLQSPSLYSL